ncbi:MAG: twin-arginine translocase TatA/TatE family subunit [Flavobacteriales bacterium]|nr:twin-arginine translocase TatA/TatE family subunit [Flavobacteriales bacterium]MDG1779330.1 twin-arginine translocase TatA/TatE family subunit [Flavobacteriales bacterium]MDG2246315.1 twin-arginine translocase TatA/TatE family subunit [Flavobacteriales bacterium]
MTLFIQNMGPASIVLILLVVVLLFGGKKIPELMKGLGKGMKEFKDASQGDEDIKKQDDSND